MLEGGGGGGGGRLQVRKFSPNTPLSVIKYSRGGGGGGKNLSQNLEGVAIRSGLPNLRITSSYINPTKEHYPEWISLRGTSSIIESDPGNLGP